MGPRLFVATTSQGKLRDFRAAAEAYSVVLDLVPGLDSIPVPEEDGATFAANAMIKAAIWAMRSRFSTTPGRCAGSSGRLSMIAKRRSAFGRCCSR